MKKNSIEEITFVENEIKNTRRLFEEVGCYVFFDEDLCKSIEHILSDYKRVLKENEEKTTILLAGAEKVKQLEKENEEYSKQLDLDYVDNNYIPKQKIKDKIEKYKNMCISSVKGYENYFKDNYNELVFRRIEQLEKELLGELIVERKNKENDKI